MITPEQIAKPGCLEHAEQAALFCWAANKAKEPGFERLSLMFAIPNGGQRGDGSKRGAAIAGGKFKAEGVKDGVSDVFLPVSMKQGDFWYHGLFIEMKRANGKPSDVSPEQRAFGESVEAQGYKFAVCFGWLEARDVILQYLGVIL